MRNRYAIGTDIVEVGRVRELSEAHGERFFKHVFTEHEVRSSQAQANPYVHLAGKFAAKEAVKKALMALGESNAIPVSGIEIVREDGRHPTVKINCVLLKSYKFQISISHTSDLATAVALAEMT